MNPLIIGGLLSAAGSIGGSLWSTHKQKKENERNRQYNLELAKMQNQWNLEQWKRENSYNELTNQKSRIISAGLNPDMLYGNGSISNTAASSPEMTAGQGSSPMDWSSLAKVNPVDSYLDAKLKQAQIDNINADTQKKGAETSILSSDASFREAYNNGLLETQNASISLSKSNVELTNQQILESQSRIRQIDANCQEISTRISQIQNSIQNDNARLNLESVLNAANIKKIASECNLNYEQANNIAQQLEKVLRNYDDAHEISLGQQTSLKIANGVAQFNARLHGEGGLDKSLSSFDNVMKFVSRLSDAALGSLLK